MTPKEKLAKKKELETLRKMEEAKNAARNAATNYQKAQEMKYNQLYATDKKQGSTGMNFDQTVIYNPLKQ